LSFLGWGCEIGNWFGFFAHERLGGRSCQILERKTKPFDGQCLESSWIIKMPKAHLELSLIDELVAPNCLRRSLSVYNISSHVSWIGDTVIRTVVPWQEGLCSLVEGQRITHQDSNFYYDTEDQEVALVWPDGRHLTISWASPPEAPPTLTPYLYVRDQPAYPQGGYLHSSRRAWVVHARLLVDQPASFVYRWSKFTFWDRGPIGRHIVSPRRLASRWRAAEWRLPGRGSLYGLWPLAPHQNIKLYIVLNIQEI
jgi:hypothetical protein